MAKPKPDQAPADVAGDVVVEAMPDSDAPDAGATDPLGRPAPADYPIGVLIGVGAERTWIGEHEYVVDPETGLVTGLA